MANCIKCGRKLPPLTFGKNRKICKWCVEYEAMHNGEHDDDREQLQPVMAAPWNQRSSHPMLMTQIFAGICAAVFVAMALSTQGASISNPTTQQLIDWGADFGPLTVSGQWWRVITSTFLHIGVLHIALNMWCLWDLGALAESLYGHWTFAIVYLICGAAGSVASLAWHPATVSAGASGAIFGIAGALIASLKLGNFSAPSAAVKGTLTSVVTFAGYNLVFGTFSGRTDNAAHIGGLVAGLILGALIALAAPHRNRPIPRITVLAVVLMVVLGGAGWLQYSRGSVAHLERGRQFLLNHKTNEAIAEFKSALKQHPQNAEAHAALAHAYYIANRYPEAEAEFKRTVQLNPADDSSRYLLGVLYLTEGKKQDARDVFTSLVAANAQSVEGHFGLGLVLADASDHQNAIQEFRTAAALNPQDESPYYQMGLSYSKLKLYDDAIASYRKALDLAGDDADPQTFAALADAYEAKGMKQAAMLTRNKAEQLKTAQQ